ncbi:hypothetical protein [Amycolatopsis plumensis]|uniref:Uncharacterized protein n=1 Tax=Amycolatopsis plumensis TaxID=236508 RepID=A0ABV5U5X3_9PSEU
MKHLHHLNRFPDRFTPGDDCRLIVAFPHVLGAPADKYGRLLLALVEHLVPDHGLSFDTVQTLAWETVQELDLDAPPSCPTCTSCFATALVAHAA